MGASRAYTGGGPYNHQSDRSFPNLRNDQGYGEVGNHYLDRVNESLVALEKSYAPGYNLSGNSGAQNNVANLSGKEAPIGIGRRVRDPNDPFGEHKAANQRERQQQLVRAQGPREVFNYFENLPKNYLLII